MKAKKDSNKKIYELESEFLSAFNEAIENIIYQARIGKPLSLREILKYGFNHVYIIGTNYKGREENDFPEEVLNYKLDFNYIDEDYYGDYKNVFLEIVEKEIEWWKFRLFSVSEIHMDLWLVIPEENVQRMASYFKSGELTLGEYPNIIQLVQYNLLLFI